MCQNLFLKCRVSYKVFFNCKVLVLAETLPVFQNIIKLKNWENLFQINSFTFTKNDSSCEFNISLFYTWFF